MHGRPLIKAPPAIWNRTRFFFGGDIWKMWKETYGKCGTSMNIYKHWIGLREILQETQVDAKKNYDVL
jgi:hypothetical protein